MPNKLNSSSEITITVLGVINMYRTLASVMVRHFTAEYIQYSHSHGHLYTCFGQPVFLILNFLTVTCLPCPFMSLIPILIYIPPVVSWDE